MPNMFKIKKGIQGEISESGGGDTRAGQCGRLADRCARIDGAGYCAERRFSDGHAGCILHVPHAGLPRNAL